MTSAPNQPTQGLCGVRIAGTGSEYPERILTNADLEKLVDTSDDWIVQRTGIRERRVVDPSVEGTYTLSLAALQKALKNAGMNGSDLDLIILASVTSEMTCPSTACRIADAIGATPAGAFDLVAACSGFVYAINVADSLVRSGRHKAIGVIGCDTLSTIVDYTERSVSILFGDTAGAAILVRDDDPMRGCQYQTLRSDGSMWPSLYIPRRDQEVPEGDEDNPVAMGNLRMQGREVYKFAVSKFRWAILDVLKETGHTIEDISQFVCHQSNLRIIESAKEKLGLPDDKVHINIDKFGNCSAGSVGLCFDQLWQAGKINNDDLVMLVAFGGGLTWASSLWKI